MTEKAPNQITAQFYIPVPGNAKAISQTQTLSDVITPGKLRLPAQGLTGVANISRKPFLTKTIIDGYKNRGFKCIPVDVRITSSVGEKGSPVARIDMKDLQDPSRMILHLNWAKGSLLDYIAKRWGEILKENGAPDEPTFQWGSFITWRPDLIEKLLDDDLFGYVGGVGYSVYDPVANEVIPLITIFDPDIVVEARPLRSGLKVDLPERLFM